VAENMALTEKTYNTCYQCIVLYYINHSYNLA